MEEEEEEEKSFDNTIVAFGSCLRICTYVCSFKCMYVCSARICVCMMITKAASCYVGWCGVDSYFI